jgi:nitrite reductase/ring-hydroxylating ferredoxin subunit
MAGRPLEAVRLAASGHSSTVEICGVDQLWDGEMECFCVGNTTILLVKIDGQFHAYQGHCPHQGAALEDGELDDGLLICPAHRWQFNATNGQGVNPKSAQLRRFPVHVVERKVVIELGPDDVNVTPVPQAFADGHNERRSRGR